MTSKAIYTDEGIVLTIYGLTEGLSVLIPDHMTVAAMENHVRELVDWLS